MTITRRNIALDSRIPKSRVVHPKILLEVERTVSKGLLAYPEVPARSKYRGWLRELFELRIDMDPARFNYLHQRLCSRQGWGEAR